MTKIGAEVSASYTSGARLWHRHGGNLLADSRASREMDRLFEHVLGREPSPLGEVARRLKSPRRPRQLS